MALASACGLDLEFFKSDNISSLSPCPATNYDATSFLLPDDITNTVVPIDNGVQCKDTKIKFAHGTTTLAFKYNNGVIIAVDSRATRGAYIASQTVDKVITINSYLLGTMAGGAADCLYWERFLGFQCRKRELEEKRRVSVATASKLLSNILYSYRGMGLSVGTMIVGWDENRGPEIYYVDNEGSRYSGHIFSVGSGSPFAYGILDNDYREDLSDEEAYDLAKRAIFHATYRDAASGGSVGLFHMKQDGWTKIGRYDVKDLYDKYMIEK